MGRMQIRACCGRRPGLALSVLWAVLWASACTGHILQPPAAAPLSNEYALIVTAAKGDTWAGLAEVHLGDAAKAWWIEAYNGAGPLAPGRRVVIPRRPVGLGGLRVDGYQTVPVLLYDRIAAAKTPGAVAAADFEAHLEYLAGNGFRPSTLSAFMAFLDLEDQVPPKAVVVTLEGSERWIFDVAYPILKRRGSPAALFTIPAMIGRQGHLTWEHLRIMAADGVEIGLLGGENEPSAAQPASGNHALSWQRLAREIGAGREALQSGLQRPCNFFAYPAGRADDIFAAHARKQGFRAAFTRENGANPFFSDPFLLKRQAVGADVDLKRFDRLLITFHQAELR